MFQLMSYLFYPLLLSDYSGYKRKEGFYNVEFIKYKEEWVNLQTNEHIPFGEIAIKMYNEFSYTIKVIYDVTATWRG